jgi:hypothetical protein
VISLNDELFLMIDDLACWDSFSVKVYLGSLVRLWPGIGPCFLS